MWAGAGNCPAHFYIRALHSRALQRVPEPQRKKPLQSIATAFYDFGQKRNRIPLCSRPIFRKRTNKKTNKNKSDPLVARLKHITAGAAGRSARRGAWGAVAAPHHGSLFSRASSAKVVAKQRALCNRGFQPSTRACCVPGALSFFGCDDGRTSSASAQSDFKSSSVPGLLRRGRISNRPLFLVAFWCTLVRTGAQTNAEGKADIPALVARLAARPPLLLRLFVVLLRLLRLATSWLLLALRNRRFRAYQLAYRGGAYRVVCCLPACLPAAEWRFAW